MEPVPKSPLEILHVIPYFSPAFEFGGPATVSDAVTTGLAAKGYIVQVWTSDVANRNGNHLERGLPDKAGRVVSRYKYTLRPLFRIANLLITPGMAFDALFRTVRPDLIHLHDFRSFQAVCAYTLARRQRIPFILQPHGTLKIVLGKERAKRFYDWAVGRRLLARASKVIALSPAEVRDCLELGVAKSRIALISNAVTAPAPDANLSTGRFRSENGIREDSIVVLFLGRVRASKGVFRLLEAFEPFAKIHPDSILAICGPDEGAATELRRLVNSKSLNLVMPGMLTGARKVEALVDADIFCLPSEFETQSVALLEAAEFGLPIIAGAGNAPPEFVFSGAGIFTDLSPRSLSIALAELGGSPELRAELGMRAKAVVQRSFDFGLLLSGLIECYREVLVSARTMAARHHNESDE